MKMKSWSARGAQFVCVSSIALGTTLLGVGGSAAFAQSVTAGTDQLVKRVCTDQCAQQGEKMATDGTGNAIAAWSENGAIVVARYEAYNNKWGASQVLINENGYNPQIGMDGSGNALLTWSVFREGEIIIRFARYITAQHAWTGAADGITLPTFYSYNVDMKVGRNGDAFLINGGRNRDGSLVRFDAATSTFTLFDHYASDGDKIAIDPAGNAILINLVQQLFSNDLDLSARRYDAASRQWSPAVVLDTHRDVFDYMGNTKDFVTIPTFNVSVDNYGSAMVVWSKGTTLTGSTYTDNEVKSARFQPWRGAWIPKTVPKISNGRSEGASLAADRSANVNAVWTEYVGPYAKTVSSRYSAATGTWSTPHVIQSGNFGSRDASIATDPQGNVIASWSQRTDSGTDNTAGAIFKATAARFTPATNTWGQPVTVQDANQNGYRPYMGVDNSGRAVMLWTQNSGATLNGVPVKEIRADRVLPQ